MGAGGYAEAMDGPARVAATMRARNLAATIERFPAGTATAPQAAAAVGCEVAQIVKTLISLAGDRPTAVLIAGDRQVDTGTLAQLLGVPRKQLRMGAAAEVRELTGFEVGAVPPFGLPSHWDVIADTSLQRFDAVWAAAGATDAVVRIGTRALIESTDAQLAVIAQERG